MLLWYKHLPILPQRDQCKPFTHFFSVVTRVLWGHGFISLSHLILCLNVSMARSCVWGSSVVCVCIYSIYTYRCYLYVCEIERGMRSLESHTGTHAHTLVSPSLSAFLLIHLMQLSGQFYRPASWREIASDKLGWPNQLGTPTDPATLPPPSLPPPHPLSPYIGDKSGVPK